MTHFHVSAWTLAIVLFIITFFVMKSDREKPAKILHMIVRVFYILILATGADLLRIYFTNDVWGAPILKAIIGILVIGFMEMILIRTKKSKSTGMFWGLWVVSLIAVFFMGYGVLG